MKKTFTYVVLLMISCLFIACSSDDIDDISNNESLEDDKTNNISADSFLIRGIIERTQFASGVKTANRYTFGYEIFDKINTNYTTEQLFGVSDKKGVFYNPDNIANSVLSSFKFGEGTGLSEYLDYHFSWETGNIVKVTDNDSYTCTMTYNNISNNEVIDINTITVPIIDPVFRTCYNMYVLNKSKKLVSEVRVNIGKGDLLYRLSYTRDAKGRISNILRTCYDGKSKNLMSTSTFTLYYVQPTPNKYESLPKIPELSDAELAYSGDVSTGDAVDLGLSVIWRNSNLKLNGKDVVAYWADATGKSQTPTYKASTELPVINICGSNKDIAKALLGGKWRLPSEEDVLELSNLCYKVPIYNKLGKVVSYRIIGPNGESISLYAPAGTSVKSKKDADRYRLWTGNANRNGRVKTFNMYGGLDWDYATAKFGVRPVSDK